MSETNLVDIVAKAAEEAAAEHLPQIAHDALAKAAEEAEDSLAKAVLTLFADLSLDKGPEAVSLVADEIGQALDTKRAMNVAKLNEHLNAHQLTYLADALESAEADKRKQHARFVAGLGGFVAHLGEILVASAARQLVGKLR